MALVFHECMLMNTRINRSVFSMFGHELGPNELKYLQLPKSTKEEVSVKISIGIPLERILQGAV